MNYNNFGTPSLNDAGQIAFQSALAGSGVTFPNNNAIFSDAGGSGLTAIARAGSQAPGFVAGVNFVGLSPPDLNNSGGIVFRSSLTGPGITATNNTALFTDANGTGLQPIVNGGDQAAGLAAGIAYTSFSVPLLNDGGQIAFWAGLRGPGVDSSNDRAFFAANAFGELEIVARLGDMINVSSDPMIDDFRMLIDFDSGFDWNNNSELAFRATFSDGSQAILVATVPAPGAAGLMALAGFAGLRRRR